MARHKGFLSSLAQSHREAERQRLSRVRVQSQNARTAATAQAAYQRNVLAYQKLQMEHQKIQMQAQANYQQAMWQQQKAQQEAYEKSVQAYEKEQKRLYLESRIAEVEYKNEEIRETINTLTNLLTATLLVDDYLDINKLKIVPQLPQFQPGMLAVQSQPPMLQNYLPQELTGMQKLKPGAKSKYDQDLAAAHQRYQADFTAYQMQESQRQNSLHQIWQNHQRQIAHIQEQVASQNIEIENFKTDFQQGKPEAIINYFTLVLEASNYPDNFPRHAKLGFIPETKQLVVDYDLPSFDIIPEVSSYSYVKTTDQVTVKTATLVQRKSLYGSVVAQIAIRTLHELFEADRAKLIDTVVFNGYVEAPDRATGHNIRVCLVTVRAFRDDFLRLELSRINPVDCLRTLSGSISKSPDELAPVRPVLEFNMVDSRFIDETDMLSELDQRISLMFLTPSEFETLVSNLFNKMGMETKLTRASRDGGVDCVAFDSRPIFGGKVVIQAKRYRNKVGVAAVRDLYGTMHNEQASKGILITTSDYTKGAYDFAQNKPLELLNGSNLLYLLKEHAGIEARLVVPENWVDSYNFEGD